MHALFWREELSPQTPHSSVFIECSVLSSSGFESVANEGFGADFERYSWVQTLHDATITIPVSLSLRARDVDCRILPKHLFVSIRGESSPILDVHVASHLDE